MAYVGTPIDTTNTFQSLTGDRFDGDASETAFTLSTAPASTLDIEVFVGNVRQDPNSAYTVSGTTLTFTGAPPSGTNNIYVVHQAKAVGTIDVPTGGVVAGSLGSSVLTGQTDIGGAIADADLFLLDDGAGGTLRKTAASRIKTYMDVPSALAGIDDQSSSNDDQLTIKDAEVVINEDSDAVNFRVETDDVTHMLFVKGNNVAVNDDATDATRGFGINQADGDSNIFTLKSSDVAHGITDEIQTDTWAAFVKQSGASGGLQMKGFTETDQSIVLDGYATTVSTAHNTGGNAVVTIQTRLKTGTGITAVSSNANLFSIANNGTAKFLVDAEGDTFSDGSAGTYDAYDDAQLVRAFDLSHGKGVIDSKFDKFVSYNHEKLAELNLVGREDDGTPNHFINTTGMQRLHNGAIWQQYEKHNQLLEAVYDLAKEAVGEKKANAILDKHEVKRLN